MHAACSLARALYYVQGTGGLHFCIGSRALGESIRAPQQRTAGRRLALQILLWQAVITCQPAGASRWPASVIVQLYVSFL